MWLFWLWFIVYGLYNSVCVSMFCGCYVTGALWVIQSFWTQRDLCRVNGTVCCCGCNGGRVLRWTACWMFTENSSPGTLRERWLFWDGSDNTMPVFSIEEEWLWWNGMEKWPGIELISEHQKGPASNSHTLFLVLFVRKSQWAYVNEMMNIRIWLSGCQATQSFDATQWCHCGMQELFFFFFFFFWPVSSTDNTWQFICVAILSSFTAFFPFFLFFFFIKYIYLFIYFLIFLFFYLFFLY